MSTYQVVFHAKVAAEVRGFPERPGKALFDVLVATARAPRGVTTPDPLMDDETFRFALFDDGDGIVHLKINDDARTVTVHSVTWIG